VSSLRQQLQLTLEQHKVHAWQLTTRQLLGGDLQPKPQHVTSHQ
jgi:hypothetical protein